MLMALTLAGAPNGPKTKKILFWLISASLDLVTSMSEKKRKNEARPTEEVRDTREEEERPAEDVEKGSLPKSKLEKREEEVKSRSLYTE